MCKPRTARHLASGADVIPDVHAHNRHTVILVERHMQPVRERELGVLHFEFRWRWRDDLAGCPGYERDEDRRDDSGASHKRRFYSRPPVRRWDWVILMAHLTNRHS